MDISALLKKSGIHCREIWRGKGKQRLLVWYEIFPDGHRFQPIQSRYELDGIAYLPPSFIVKKSHAPYAVAMTVEKFVDWVNTLRSFKNIIG